MFDDLPPDLERLLTLRVWHAMWLERIDRKVAAVEQRQAEAERGRRLRPAPPDWVASFGGDFEALPRALDSNVKLTVDTPDGVVVTLGSTKVAVGARMLSGEVARLGPCCQRRPRPHVVAPRRTLLSVIAFTVLEARITAIHIVVDPVELASIQLPAPA